MRAIRVLAASAAVLLSRAGEAAPTVTAGVGVSGLQVGTVPALAVTPHVEVGWQVGDTLTVSLRDSLSVLPDSARGVGVNNRTAVSVGYAWPTLSATVGLSLAAYELSACRPELCARVRGLAPGAEATADWYSGLLAGALGVRVAVSVGWYGGASAVLSGGPVVSATAGPLLRFGRRQ